MPKLEKSCGVVVYCHAAEGSPRHYLLLHYPNGHWDFAKGHVEQGEGQMEAALRELQEETGIRRVQLHEGFRHVFDYWYYRETGRSHKEVTFFLGRAPNRKVTLSHEHRGYVWLPYKEALGQITYSNAKQLLARVEQFLVKAERRAG